MKEEDDDEKPKRKVSKNMVDCFCEKYMPATENTADTELGIYDIRMFFNLFYVSDPTQDMLDEYLNSLCKRGYQMSVSYEGEPTMYVRINN
ncbi:MAG: hypothetical protein ACI36Z_09990 [Alloprevotella sp.]